MAIAVAHVGVQRGNNLVARFGAAAAVVAITDVDDDPFVPALLAALDGWSGEPGSPASTLAWTVAALTATHQRSAPAFGAVVRLEDGFLVLLRGPVRAVIDGADGGVTPLELTGKNSLTWVDRVVRGTIRSISVTLAEAGAVQVDPRSDLRGGLVDGDGLVLTPDRSAGGTRPSPADKGSSAPAAADPTPATSGSKPSMPSMPRGSRTAPQPVASVSGPAGSRITTEGLPIGFRPGPPAQETAIVEVTAKALVADDGARILLDRHYVFGRDPYQDQSVVRGAASPIVVRDPDQLISRVQVYVSTVAGTVTVLDGGSANGTFIAPPGAKEWMRLGGQPAVLPPGWSMRIGRRVYTYVVPEPVVS